MEQLGFSPLLGFCCRFGHREKLEGEGRWFRGVLPELVREELWVTEVLDW